MRERVSWEGCERKPHEIRIEAEAEPEDYLQVHLSNRCSIAHEPPKGDREESGKAYGHGYGGSGSKVDDFGPTADH